MKPLITGGSGILGKELRKYFPESLCPSRNDLDITNSTLVSDYFSKNDFDMFNNTFHIQFLEPNNQIIQKKYCINIALIRK